MAENNENTPTDGDNGQPPLPPPVPPQPQDAAPAPSPMTTSAPSAPSVPPAQPQMGGTPTNQGAVAPVAPGTLPAPATSSGTVGTPATGAAPSSAGGDDFLHTLGNDFKQIFAAFKAIFAGRLPHAFQIGDRVRYLSAILITLAALVSGLIYANAGSHMFAAASDLFDSTMSMLTGGSNHADFEMPFDIWFKLVLSAAISAAVVYLLRALELFLTVKLSKGETTYGKMLRLQAFTLIPYTVILFPLWLILILPIKAFALIIFGLMMLILPALLMMNELMLYVGINRTTRLGRSPLVPHVLLSGVTFFIGTFLASLILSSVDFY